MKQFLTLLALATLAISYCPAQTLLTQSIQAGEKQAQHSATQLEARNLIAAQAAVDYSAAQAVLLQPGFTAQAGSVFSATIRSESARSVELAHTLTLRAYPNPFRGLTRLEYNLPRSAQVTYSLTNLQGQIMGQHSGTRWQEAGQHQLDLPGADLPQGFYLYHLQVGSNHKVIRLLKQP